MATDAIDLVAAADAAERCAWSALANLTSTDSTASIAGRNPLDYVPSTYDGLKYCLYEQAAKNNIDLNWFLIMVILVIIMTVLFGPFWAILIPLRMLGFGALGVMPGTSPHLFPTPEWFKIRTDKQKTASVAAMLQSVFYGGHTPAGGWFATFTRWGMTAIRGFF